MVYRPLFGILVFLAAAASFLVVLGGCASASKSTAHSPDGPAHGDPRPAKGAAMAAELLPWVGADGVPSPLEAPMEDGSFLSRFEVVEGSRTGLIMHQIRRAGLEPNSWIITRRFEGESEAQEERRQQIDPQDGSLVLPLLLNFERGVSVEMKPAPITVPGRLEAGQTTERELSLRLPYLKNPRKLREKGTGRAEMTYFADQEMTTAAGAYETKHLREIFTSNLTNAVGTRTIDRWFAPGVGLIAERWEEEVKVFGIVVERTIQGIRALPPSIEEPIEDNETD